MMNIDMVWWISAIEIPLFSALFWLYWRMRQDHEKQINLLRDVIESRHAQMREALSGYKLEVAKNYASISDMKEIEQRLVAYLLRIEAKLDTTAMKTEVLHARKDKT
jgi:heme/copper-type cytochrome/quinol oxidase subunit 3